MCLTGNRIPNSGQTDMALIYKRPFFNNKRKPEFFELKPVDLFSFEVTSCRWNFSLLAKGL